MRTILTMLAVTAMGTTPALAGSPVAPPQDPVIAAPAPVISASPDWTGFYGGAQLGWGNVDTNIPGVSGDDMIGGLTFGYDYDLGDWVVGGGLLYGTGGYANADTNLIGDEDGYFVGAGYEHLISDNFSLGGEVLYHEFDGFNTVPSTDLEATTVQVRGTFRF